MKKSNKKAASAAMFALLVAVFVAAGFGTWALYKSVSKGTGTFNAGGWSIKVNGSDVSQNGTFRLLIDPSRTMDSGSEGHNYIQSPLIVDASKTSTTLAYKVSRVCETYGSTDSSFGTCTDSSSTGGQLAEVIFMEGARDSQSGTYAPDYDGTTGTWASSYEFDYNGTSGSENNGMHIKHAYIKLLLDGDNEESLDKSASGNSSPLSIDAGQKAQSYVYFTIDPYLYDATGSQLDYTEEEVSQILKGQSIEIELMFHARQTH